MTKLKQLQLQQQIFEIVQNETLENLFGKIDMCNCSITIKDGKIYGTIGFTASQIAPYLRKKMGYWVRKEIIKHALRPLKQGELFYKTS